MQRVRKHLLLQKTGLFVKWNQDKWVELLNQRPETCRLRMNAIPFLEEGKIYPVLKNRWRAYYIILRDSRRLVFINYDEIRPLRPTKEELKTFPQYDIFNKEGFWYYDEW